MSSLKKQAAKRPAIVEAPLPKDYKPQHPMHEWRPTAAAAESDHLDEYTEVEPFEATEGLMDKAKAYKDKRKMKGAAKKVRKLIQQIEKPEKKIRQIRAKQKDKKAFDAYVQKKLDKEDKEIYREATN